MCSCSEVLGVQETIKRENKSWEEPRENTKREEHRAVENEKTRRVWESERRHGYVFRKLKGRGTEKTRNKEEKLCFKHNEKEKTIKRTKKGFYTKILPLVTNYAILDTITDNS